MSSDWTASAIAHLTDYRACPRCGARPLNGGVCPVCHADLTGPEAVRLAEATQTAVSALHARAQVIDLLPTAHPSVAAPAVLQPQTVQPPSAVQAPRMPQPTPAEPARPSSQLSLQSVLAVAGAGLLAVAAIVFTFNRELIGDDARTGIIAVLTVVFLAGAWLISRAGLRFSAESIGALGMVFVVLDIWSFSRYAVGLDPWTAGAIGTLFAAAVMIGVAALARIRTWLWAGLVGLAIVPAMLGYGAGDSWYSVLGHLGTGFLALGISVSLVRLSGRFASLAVERATMTGITLLVAIVVVAQQLFETPPFPLDRALTAAAVFAALALLSVLSTVAHFPRFWSGAAGAFATIGAVLVPFTALGLQDDALIFFTAPAAAFIALCALSGVVQLGRHNRAGLHRADLLAGSWAVTIASAIPAGLFGLIIVLTGVGSRDGDSTQLAALGGIGIAFLAGIVVTLLAPRVARTPGAATGLRVIASGSAAWFGMYLLLVFSSWSLLPLVAQVAIGVVVAVAAIAVPLRVTTPLRVRVPLTVGAHVILLHTIAQSWSEPLVGVIAGVAVVGAIVVLSYGLPRAIRPLHIGVALAYALVVLGRTLADFTILEDVAVLALTATLGLLVALAATLIDRLRIGFWYAILAVAAVPFALSLGLRIVDDAGWVAIPAAVGVALGVAFLVSQRPGLLSWLRVAGAAAIVPGLAVVTVGVLPQLLSGSGSPVVLPVIAGIVALTLPFTAAVDAWLAKRGLPEPDARAARLAIETSALATAAIAVLLALSRSAAGFDTTFLVLAIVGLGGAATALFSGRRYGWVIAYAAWSGALWCVFALWGVGVLEPYVLPPALAAVVIGTVAVYRGRPGQWMVVVGLAVSALTSLSLLAGDNRDLVATSWRLWGLLAASVVLLVIGALLPRAARLVSLQAPVLGVAALAASAGAIEAVQRGSQLPPTYLDTTSFAIFGVLGFAALAAVIAAAAARVLSLEGSRWTYVPAFLYLLVGPAIGGRPDPISIWTLFGLMVALLAVMVLVTVRTRTRDTTLPPVWFLFAVAWVAGVASWSQREILRVDAYSITMGAALLLVGALAWRSSERPASANSWPIGYTGSWQLLTPGLFVLFAASIASTLTDPQTWRAVLVIVLALAAILLGSRLKLAAPFLLGIGVLPLENVLVFAVQSNKNMESTPWWITLASAGAVLLVIAITAERRTTGGGIAARIRDLD